MSFRLSTLIALSAIALQASAQTLSITSLGAIGTGCAPGTVKARVNSDQSVSLSFADFKAETSASAPISEGRVNCQLTLGVQVPSGYQFAFDKTVLNAAYNAGSGVKLSSSTTYYYQGQLSESSGSCAVAGPASSGYEPIVNKFSPLLWSPCGTSTVVNLNTDLRADNGNTKNSGYITVRNSTDASFIWRKC